MGLYTEKQVSNLIHTIYPQISRDEFCTIMQAFIPIELPSEEDIVFAADDIAYYGSDAVCFEAGAEWAINHIKQQDHEGKN